MEPIRLYELLGVLLFLSPLLLAVIAFAASSIKAGIRDLRKRRVEEEGSRTPLKEEAVNSKVKRYIRELMEKRRK